jgi:type IV secretory pathway VirB10-like protein
VLGTSVRPKLVNEAINERMGLAAQWLVLPNGARIDLTRSAMLDAGGVAAIDGDVNRHVLATLGGVVAYGVIGGWGAVEAAKRTDQNNAATAVGLLSGQRSAGAEIAQGLADIGKRVAARYLNLVPTITLRPGTPMNVFLDDEMVLQAWAPIDEFAPAVAQRP